MNNNLQQRPKLLIANRGEIACRIIATAQRLNIPTVALFSDADRDARHVQLADEALRIGPAPSAQSYLQIEAIIAAAKQTGATMIHPGYGFLSENAAFATACVNAGLTFVGPSAAAITLMSDKATAKQTATTHNIPVIEGYKGQDQTDQTLWTEAQRIGAPLLLKATAGGGGKGMRLITDISEPNKTSFMEALASVRREAKSSFADDTLMLERYIEQPRHVEVQIIADQQGAVIHLWDRDCSIQRRHQKVVEEAPAPNLSDALRQRLQSDATLLAKSIGYSNAGTVEFLVDPDEKHYFLEMNTRLQVEHPVTEAITGVDLVELQLNVARGLPLPKQSAIALNGHAIEVRLNAENPKQQFQPAIGKIDHLKWPDTIRVDTGIIQDSTITIHYDPNLAKLIAWGNTRIEAQQGLWQALQKTELIGVKHNLYFLQEVISHPAFLDCKLNTHFLTEHALPQDSAANQDDPTHSHTEATVLAAVTLYQILSKERTRPHHNNKCHNNKNQDNNSAGPHSPWASHPGWRLNQISEQHFHYDLETSSCQLLIQSNMQSNNTAALGSHDYRMIIGETSYDLSGTLSNHQVRLILNGQQVQWTVVRAGERYCVLTGTAEHWVTPARFSGSDLSQQKNSQQSSPMPGTVIKIMAQPGETLEANAPIMVLEAMKMEHTLTAPGQGKVTELLCQEGDLVDEGSTLFLFDSE